MDVKNAWFYSVVVAVTGIATAFLFYYGYEMSFVILNDFYAPWADFFFAKITHLGDGLTLPALWYWAYGRKDIPKMMALISCLLVMAGIVQVLKNVFFSDWYRPLVVFGEQWVHHQKGYEAYGNTFPSGHTAAIFCILFCLAQWQLWSPWLQLLGALLGLSVAYSRIYLGVHFLGDVLAGLLIGALVSHTSFRFFSLKWSKLPSHNLISKSLAFLSVSILITLWILRVILNKNF